MKKKHTHPIMTNISQTSSRVMKRFSRFSLDRQIAFIFLALLTFVVVFFPLVIFNSIDGSTSWALRFLGGWFWKSTVIMIVLLVALWWWHFIPRFKYTVHQTLGFQDNDHLFVFFLLFVWFGLLVGMQEAVSFVGTTTVGLWFGYFAVLVLLLIGMLYSLVKLLDDAKVLKKNSFMGFVHKRKKSSTETPVSSLFDEDGEGV